MMEREKKYDIFLGKNRGYHTFRIEPNADSTTLERWLDKGYRIDTEYQIGWFTYEVYLVKA